MCTNRAVGVVDFAAVLLTNFSFLFFSFVYVRLSPFTITRRQRDRLSVRPTRCRRDTHLLCRQSSANTAGVGNYTLQSARLASGSCRQPRPNSASRSVNGLRGRLRGADITVVNPFSTHLQLLFKPELPKRVGRQKPTEQWGKFRGIPRPSPIRLAAWLSGKGVGL